jgi:hypothetical protein
MEEVIEKVDDIESNKNLKNTIELDDGFYNINAVEADVAKETQAALALEPSFGSRTDLEDKYKGSFNGNEDKAIKYVPADGGTFTGVVHVYDNDRGYGLGTEENPIEDSEILNYGQIEQVISNLKGNPLWKWDPSSATVDNNSDSANAGYTPIDGGYEQGKIYGLNTVIGSAEDLPLFEAYATGEAHNKYITPDSYDNAYITYGSTYCDAYFNQAYLDKRETITKLVFKGKVVNSQNVEKGLRIRAAEFTASSKANPPYGFLNLETVYINPGAIWIDNSAFKGCTNLITADIPNSIEKIGKNAFEGCTKLTSIVLGNNLKEIQSGAFKDCTCLKSIAICTNGTEIENFGTDNEKIIAKITIASDAFVGCTALKKVYYKGTADEWKVLTSGNNLLNNLEVVTISDTAFPFLYICKTDETDTSLTSNKMFLKLPGEALVEVSKGAARLERRDSKTSGNVDYFTYDVLAAVIAGINSRITALGSQALALPEKLKIYDTDHTAVLDVPVNVASADVDKALIVEEPIVPTVEELQTQITKVTGVERTFTPITEQKTTVLKEPVYDDDGNVVEKDGEITYNTTTVTKQEIVGYNVSYTNPNNYTGAIESVLQAKADEVGRNIQTGYYRKTTNKFTKEGGKEDGNDQANTITISNEIPNEETPGEWKIGDIMIVINTGDGEYK